LHLENGNTLKHKQQTKSNVYARKMDESRRKHVRRKTPLADSSSFTE
jgi:hypothetical protein